VYTLIRERTRFRDQSFQPYAGAVADAIEYSLNNPGFRLQRADAY